MYAVFSPHGPVRCIVISAPVKCATTRKVPGSGGRNSMYAALPDHSPCVPVCTIVSMKMRSDVVSQRPGM